MSIRDKLKEVERKSYDLSIETSSHVRDNYNKVIARMEKEIAELKNQVAADHERLTGWRTGITQIATNAESRLKANMITMLDAEIANRYSEAQYYDPEIVAEILTEIKKEGIL